jgi:hypothetical protein
MFKRSLLEAANVRRTLGILLVTAALGAVTIGAGSATAASSGCTTRWVQATTTTASGAVSARSRLVESFCFNGHRISRYTVSLEHSQPSWSRWQYAGRTATADVAWNADGTPRMRSREVLVRWERDGQAFCHILSIGADANGRSPSAWDTADC